MGSLVIFFGVTAWILWFVFYCFCCIGKNNYKEWERANKQK